MQAAEAAWFQVATSQPLVSEVGRVLTEKFGWPAARVTEATELMERVAETVAPREAVTDCPDDDDNRVLECAQESGADYIVTGDAHLLTMHPWRGVTILKAAQFLALRPWLPPSAVPQ